MAVANNDPNNLETLENQLRELSHDDRVLTIIQDFADKLGWFSCSDNYGASRC